MPPYRKSTPPSTVGSKPSKSSDNAAARSKKNRGVPAKKTSERRGAEYKSPHARAFCRAMKQEERSYLHLKAAPFDIVCSFSHSKQEFMRFPPIFLQTSLTSKRFFFVGLCMALDGPKVRSKGSRRNMKKPDGERGKPNAEGLWRI